MPARESGARATRNGFTVIDRAFPRLLFASFAIAGARSPARKPTSTFPPGTWTNSIPVAGSVSFFAIGVGYRR